MKFGWLAPSDLGKSRFSELPPNYIVNRLHRIDGEAFRRVRVGRCIGKGTDALRRAARGLLVGVEGTGRYARMCVERRMGGWWTYHW
jgi:hypothetical protein